MPSVLEVIRWHLNKDIGGPHLSHSTLCNASTLLHVLALQSKPTIQKENVLMATLARSVVLVSQASLAILVSNAVSVLLLGLTSPFLWWYSQLWLLLL